MEALSLFRANGALCHQQYLSKCVCENVCDSLIFLYIYRLQLPGLFVSKRLSDFVVKDSLMPSRVRVSFFFCACTSIMCVYTACVCAGVCV